MPVARSDMDVSDVRHLKRHFYRYARGVTELIGIGAVTLRIRKHRLGARFAISDQASAAECLEQVGAGYVLVALNTR